MREILFRAQMIDSNEWVYGSLVYSPSENQYYIVEHSGDELQYPVEEETIGQYTGLLDTNGGKIFEGDIIYFSAFDCFGNDTQYKGVVKWQYARFTIDNKNDDVYFDLALVYSDDDGIEVIGNIHDNPELLSEV